MNKIKVLHIINSLGKGGAERLLLDICRELNSSKDVEYLILSLSHVNEYHQDSVDLNINYCNASVKLSILKKTNIQLEEYNKIVDSFSPDIIHSHLYHSEIISREKTNNKIIYITHLHGYENQLINFSFSTIISKRKLTNWYEKRRLILKYKHCNNYYIAISNYVKESFKKTMPSAFSSKIFLLPNAIDFNRFYTSKNQFANKTTNKIFFKLISIGKINENKNQIFLIDVMKLMKDKGYDVRLTLVGDNAHSSELQLKTLKNGLEKDIELVGITDNVEDLLEKSDLYVHAAKNEAFGLVLIEAMAAGLPVVSLDGKGNRDIIEQGKNGFMVYEQNAELFAEKIIELINNKELYHSMSDYAVAFARKYDIKEYVNKLTDVYKKLTAFP